MSGIFGKIKSLIIGNADGSILGVDIGSSTIKIVQIKKQSDKIVLENYGAIALGPYVGLSVGQVTNATNEKLAEALIDLIRETNINTKRASFAIPLKDTMISLIDMPDVGDKQLNSMVPIEARKHIPVPISEVMLNFLVMPRLQNVPKSVSSTSKTSDVAKSKIRGSVEVLIVAIHNSSIDRYQDIKDKVNLEAKMFEVEVFSTTRALIGNDINTIVILDIGASVTKIAIVDGGILRESHIINRGSQDITVAMSKSFNIDMNKAEIIKRDPSLLDDDLREQFMSIVSSPLGYIFSEVNSVLLNYEKKNNKTVKKIVLSGGGVLLNGVFDFAKDNFKVKVVVGNPFERIRTPAFLKDTLKNVGPEFAVAIGLALEALE